MSCTVSIIICTRNRASSLCSTLESISKAEVPSGWICELLVVDNGSTDATKSSVAALSLPHLTIRYLHEPRAGKGHAYNAGMASAAGRAFLFTDDDVRVPINWIEGMCRPILDGKADAVQGGIRIAPHLERFWLTDPLRIWVAAVEHPQHPPEGLVGANMAFAREMSEIAGGFDPRLGPGASGFYDDTLFGWLLKRAGRKILYLPHISVEHHFDSARLTFQAFLSTARRMAASRAIVLNVIEPDHPRSTFIDLLAQMPGLAVRCFTQLTHLVLDQRPDASFLSRYHRLCLWVALRKRDS